jgi:hypothetical protein
MAKQGEAPRGRPMTLVWMILALVMVGGFLTWLGVASEPTTVVVLEENDENGNGVPGDVVAVERDTLAANVGQYEGQEILVRGVASTGRLGPEIFWGELGDVERQIPILIRMDPGAAGQAQIQAGVAYSISGQVLRVTDELVETWAAEGEFAGEGEQLQATFADYYIQARSVRPTTGARGRGS